MKNLFKNTIIAQAISLGFDFKIFTNESEVQEIENEMLDFFYENREKLEQIEDECEVTSNGRSQNVNHGDYTCSGDIVDFAQHWHKSPETKIFHSDYLIEQDDIIKNMNLYYLVGETEYNAPDGFIFSKKINGHIKIEKELNFYVYDKEDVYLDGESLECFESENEAIEFVNSQNAAYGYIKFYYKYE